MVDQVAGGFKMATAHRAREDLLLLLLPTLLVESASKHDVNTTGKILGTFNWG